MEDLKLATLCKIAQSMDAQQIRWAVGGSLMLYLRGAAKVYNDIDLVIATDDAKAAIICLDALCEPLDVPPPPSKARIFHSRYFRQYQLDGVDIDLMAGMAIRTDAIDYYDAFDILGPCGYAEVKGRRIPLGAMEDWLILYSLMVGRQEKVRMIHAHWKNNAKPDSKRLAELAKQPLPDALRHEVLKIMSEY